MEITFENILGIIMVVIGVVALGFIINAKGKFPAESELMKITRSLIPAILFLILFSSWHLLREFFHWKEAYGEFMEYPEYLFISIVYIMIFRSAKNLYNIAKEYGVVKE
jgi:uncharacterized membrane protein